MIDQLFAAGFLAGVGCSLLVAACCLGYINNKMRIVLERNKQAQKALDLAIDIAHAAAKLAYKRKAT